MSVAVGVGVAPIISIALIETDTTGSGGGVLFASLLGGAATFLLVPERYRAKGGAAALGLVSLVLALLVTFIGTFLWLSQYLDVD